MSSKLINDPDWVARMGKYFDTIDKEHKGIISIDKIQSWATNMEKLCNPTATEMVALRARLYKFWKKVGLKPGVFMTKKQFIEGVDRMGADEIRRNKEGHMTSLDKVNNAFFDIIDRDKNDVLTMEELRYIMAAATKKPKDADKFMAQADDDKSGEIDRNEFLISERRFWYKAAS